MVLGPTQAFTKESVKARWMERYTSDAVNKKFLGLPRGIYLGFVPSQSGLTLTLKTDIVITLKNVSGVFAVGATALGGTSGATATIRVVSSGYILVDNVVGTFQAAETVTAGLASAVVGEFRAEAISFGRVVSSTPLVPGRSEDMLDVLTGDNAVLDFTGFPDGTYHVILTANYQVGAATTGQIISRTTPAANGGSEVLICQVTKVGLALTVAATAPASRHEPYAFEGTRIGFMPGGSLEQLLAATLSSLEVIAARRRSDGVTSPVFDPGNAQTTGLPGRLNTDLSGASMASRLGKNLVAMQGNDFVMAAPATSNNVSGSFSARVRDVYPHRDISNGSLPAGAPIAVEANGTEDVQLTLTGVIGAFAVGAPVIGATSAASAIVRSVAGSVLTVGDFVGQLFVGEVLNQPASAAFGTLNSINLREGAVTALSGVTADRNIALLIETTTGKRPIDTNGNVVFGRLIFGPGGAAAVGEHTLTGTLNFTNGNFAVTGVGTLFTTEVAIGDIIEGADGRFYEVASIGGNLNLNLTAGKPYLGPTAPGVNRRRRRFNLEFRAVSGGVEASTTLAAGTYRPFFPTWFTQERSNFDALLTSHAPGGQTVPDATTLVKGIALNAAAGTPLIGAIRTIQNGGGPVGAGNFHTINFSAGASAGAPGVLNVTLGSGPSGPTGPTGPPGPPGPGFTQATSNAVSSGDIASAPNRNDSVTLNAGFIIRAWAVTQTFDFLAPNAVDSIKITAMALNGSFGAATSVLVNYTTESFDSATTIESVIYLTASG